MQLKRIICANTPMDYDKIKIYGTRVKVDSMEKVAEIEAAEKLKMKEKVDKIMAYQPTVFINRQLIYNYPEQLMADKVTVEWNAFLQFRIRGSWSLSMLISRVLREFQRLLVLRSCPPSITQKELARSLGDATSLKRSWLERTKWSSSQDALLVIF